MNSQIEEKNKNKKTKVIDFHNKAKLIKTNLGKILFYETGDFVHCYNEDAIIISRLMQYTSRVYGLEEKLEQYVNCSFPTIRLKAIASKIKESLKINYVHYKQIDNSDEFELKHYSNFNTKIKKKEIISATDVIIHIKNHNDEKSSKLDHTINQIKRGARSDFQLHTKMKNLFSVISTCLITDKSRKYSSILIMNFITTATTTLNEVNSFRYKKSEADKKVILEKISISLDSLKDLSQIIKNENGFKQQKHFEILFESVSELSKITRGLLKEK